MTTKKVLNKKAVKATAARLATEAIATGKIKLPPTKKAKEAAKKTPTAPVAIEPPTVPMTKLLVKNGFVHAKSAVLADEQNTAHGYNHETGDAAMFIHANTSTDIGGRWIIKHKDGSQVEGKTAKELAEYLHKPEGLAANVIAALDLLRKLTKEKFNLNDLTGDDNYSSRMKLLKTLRASDKVLAKDCGINNVIKEFHAALGIDGDSIASKSKAFTEMCTGLLKKERKLDRAVASVEKQEVKEVLKKTANQRIVHDSKPVLPGVKRLSKVKQAEADEKAKTDLAAQIAAKRKQEEYTPLAVPRPEAQIAVNLDDVCILVDPANGITLLCLEKPNSQGAICVYNNGSRVAAGVVPTERLITLRREVSDDLVRDVNQLLHPLTAGVIVTPVAEYHLTAVLAHCKEIIDMATEKVLATKKFAAPKNLAAKPTAKSAKAEKTATPKVARAASAKEHTGKKRTVFTDDLKIKVLAVALKANESGNPYREGTKARNSFELIKKSATFGDLVKLTEKSKADVYDAAYIVKWASQPHGNAPAYITMG